jgi:excisionase family DNA binding protein
MEMEKLYTTAEASDYLKVTEITIRRYIKDGKLQSQKIGRQHRITETAIKAFLDAQGNGNEGGSTNE